MKGMRLVLLMVLVLLPSAQVFGQPDMDAAEKKSVIDALCKKLDGEYMFPDVTAKFIRMLKGNLKEGKYDGIKDPREFGRCITADLAAIHRDRHLSVRFNPQWIKDEEKREKQDEKALLLKKKRDRIRNYGFEEVKILPGNIGYLKFNSFSYSIEAYPIAVGALKMLSNTDALIIDLRTNGGGSPEMVQFLCSYFLENPRKHLNSFSYKDKEKLTQYWTYTYLPGKRLDQVELYLLTSRRTFSAAEEFVYNLQSLKRATLIGETTGGGAHDNKFVILTENFMMSLPFARALNPVTKTNWEEVGVKPDIEVAQDQALATARVEAIKKLGEKNKDPQFKGFYTWHLEAYNAALNPVTVEKEVLQSYAGTYGPRTIVLEDDTLYHARGAGARIKLIPITADYFMLEGIDFFRIKFLKEGERVVAAEGYGVNGPVDKHLRNK